MFGMLIVVTLMLFCPDGARYYSRFPRNMRERRIFVRATGQCVGEKDPENYGSLFSVRRLLMMAFEESGPKH